MSQTEPDTGEHVKLKSTNDTLIQLVDDDDAEMKPSECIYMPLKSTYWDKYICVSLCLIFISYHIVKQPVQYHTSADFVAY